MIIDERIDAARIAQFAGQMEHVNHRVVSQLHGMWNGDEPDEFYAGLLAGLVTALSLVQGGMAEAYLPTIVTFVASQVRRREVAGAASGGEG